MDEEAKRGKGLLWDVQEKGPPQFSKRWVPFSLDGLGLLEKGPQGASIAAAVSPTDSRWPELYSACPALSRWGLLILHNRSRPCARGRETTGPVAAMAQGFSSLPQSLVLHPAFPRKATEPSAICTYRARRKRVHRTPHTHTHTTQRKKTRERVSAAPRLPWHKHTLQTDINEQGCQRTE